MAESDDDIDVTTNVPNPAVVAALVENHRRFLAFVQKRVGNRADAEEILQGSLAKGLARAGEIRDDERTVAWFYRILRNAIVDHWRARAAEARGAEALARESSGETAPDASAEGDLCRCFEPLLTTLRPEYAEMLRKIDLEGQRPVDVAAEQGMTPNAAMVKLHRARRALRVRLEQTCRACAEHGCLDCTCGGGPTPATSSK